MGIFQSCDNNASTEEKTDEQISEIQEVKEEQEDPYIITEEAFYGLKRGDDIPSNFKKDILETGQGNFDIVVIVDEIGEELGYLHPFDNKVGYVFVTSEKATSQHGIKVGTTFGELDDKFPNAKVYGTQDGDVYVSIGEKLRYYISTDYGEGEIDKSTIAKVAKVYAIAIH